MNRKVFKELLERYTSDGFTCVDLELTDNRTISLNCERDKIWFNESYFWFGSNGVGTSIDYRVIKGIAI